MKILLFGKYGQLGWELQRSLAPLGELTALCSTSSNLCGDLRNLAGLAETVKAVAPDVIINAAAYTAVDNAETEPETARLINALAPGVLAQAAKRQNALLIHYSTDYVFDGSGNHAWLETDSTGPLNIYGQTKREGEELIVATACRYLILRTSWVYAARGRNFIKTILRLAQQQQSLSIINDQIGAPTGAELLADVSTLMINDAKNDSDLSGIYHLVADGLASWHSYAEFIIQFARQSGLTLAVEPEAIHAVPSTQFVTPARRPLNSRLSTNKLQQQFGYTLPHWQIGVSRVLTEILEAG